MIRYVFISGPYTQGDSLVNVRRALELADALLLAGFIPFVPHLCHFWNERTGHEYEEWMAYDMAWLERCNAFIRIQGPSPGSDREEARARELGLPVFYTLNQLIHSSLSPGEEKGAIAWLHEPKTSD